MPKPDTLTEQPSSKPRPAIAELMRIPRGYKMLPESQWEEWRDPDLSGLCRNCSRKEDDHLNRVCPTRFALVNEKIAEESKLHVVLGKDYTRDELILMIGRAYPEFVNMAKQMTLLQGNLSEAQRTCIKLYELVTGREIAKAKENWVEEVETTVGLMNQAIDVLRSIAYNAPAENAKAIATKWIERLNVKLPSNVVTLVNENNGHKE